MGHMGHMNFLDEGPEVFQARNGAVAGRRPIRCHENPIKRLVRDDATGGQIFIDKYNNKWFATTGGVSILRAGKSAWDSDGWLGISKENSGLVDNLVQAIYVDPKTSEALIGTDNGLSVYTGAFGQIKPSFKDAAGGPNPFMLADENSRFIITNLKISSTVKIFTISGRLVRELSPSVKLRDGSLAVDGGRAVWDGRDLNGQKVSTGIYLYMAFTEDGKSASGKIAVIRN